MTLVRPSVLMAALGGAFPGRQELALTGMQIVGKGNVRWAKKSAWFRNVPVTAVYPTVGQMEVRVAFGRMAQEAKAKNMTGTRAKPAKSERLGREFVGAAAYIADNFYNYKAPSRMTKESYPSKLRKTLHTADELQAILNKAKGK
jgi:hypothetical protein